MVVVNGKTTTLTTPTTTSGQGVGNFIMSGIGGSVGNGTATASVAMFTGGSNGRRALDVYRLIGYIGCAVCIQFFL